MTTTLDGSTAAAVDADAPGNDASPNHGSGDGSGPRSVGTSGAPGAAAELRASVGRPGVHAVEVVLPVYNEEVDLEPSVRRLQAYLASHFPFTYVVTIADNASTDGTWALAQLLAETVPNVRATRLPEKGRGRALRAVWEASEAEVVAYVVHPQNLMVDQSLHDVEDARR